MELRRYLEIFNRRKKIFYYVMGMSVLLSLLILLLVRPTYRASVKILTKATAAHSLLSSWGMAPQTLTSSSDDVKTDVELSRIRPLAEAIIDEYKLKGLFGRALKADDFFEPSVGETLFSLPYAVVKQYKEASIIEIGVVTADPELSSSIANTISARYIEDSIGRLKRDFQSVRESIESRLQTIRDDYFKSLALSTAVKLKDMSVDLSAETSTLIKTITSLKSEVESEDKDDAERQAEITKATKHLKELSLYRKEMFEISKNDRLATLKASLDEKTVERASQKLDLTKEHPKFKQLSEEIDAIKRQMAEEADLVLNKETKSLNPEYTELSRKILMNTINREVIKARKVVIQKFIKLYEDELIKIPHKYEEFARIEPLLGAQKEMYVRVNQYAIQAAVAESIGLSKLKVVEPAVVPKKRFFPRRGRTALSSLFIGFFLGVTAIFFTEYLDSKVKSKADLPSGARFLGSIPYSDGLKSYEVFKSLGTDPKEIEAVDYIRNNIVWSASVLTIMSPKSGDGKTTVASLLAAAYARDGHRVLLVSGGGKGFTAAAFFGMDDAAPYVARPTGQHGLDLLIAPETTGSIGKIKETVAGFGGTYGKVIIDAGSGAHAAAVDGRVICVIEPYKYEQGSLDRLCDLADFEGFVFNKDRYRC